MAYPNYPNFNNYLNSNYSQSTQPITGSNTNPFGYATVPISNIQGSNPPAGGNTVNINPPGSGSTDLTVPPALPVDTSGAQSSMAGDLATIKAQLDKIQQEANKLKEEAAKLNQPDKPGQPGQPKSEEVNWQWFMDQRAEIAKDKPDWKSYNDFLQESGLKDIQAKLLDYADQVDKLEAQKQEELGNMEMAVKGRATMAWQGTKGLIERTYNSRIAAVAGQAKWLQLSYDFTKENADAWMKYQMFDYEQRVTDLDFYKDIFGDMKDEDYRTWQKERTIAQDALDQKWKELDYILKMKESEQKNDKKLSFTDLQKINEMYGLSLPYGTTEQEAQYQISGGIGEWYDEYGQGFSGYRAPLTEKADPDVERYAQAIVNRGQYRTTFINEEGIRERKIDWSQIPQDIRGEVEARASELQEEKDRNNPSQEENNWDKLWKGIGAYGSLLVNPVGTVYNWLNK